MSYYCLDCGTKLNEVNISESCDKYYCYNCTKYWYRSKRIIIEWVKKDS